MTPGDRPISAVLQDIVGNIQDIVRSEVRLARTEIGEELGRARSAGVLFSVGAVTATFSALFLLVTIMYALTLVVPAWAAALIVSAGVGIVAVVTLALGMKRLKTVHAIPKTTASLKENAQWAKQLTK
jgi:uncharacterized membrane protein YqjE